MMIGCKAGNRLYQLVGATKVDNQPTLSIGYDFPNKMGFVSQDCQASSHILRQLVRAAIGIVIIERRIGNEAHVETCRTFNQFILPYRRQKNDSVVGQPEILEHLA